MIKMVQKQDIITLRRREMSLRAIVRELKLNRATVTKVVREFEASQQADEYLEIEIGSDDILSQLSSLMGTAQNEKTRQSEYGVSY